MRFFCYEFIFYVCFVYFKPTSRNLLDSDCNIILPSPFLGTYPISILAFVIFVISRFGHNVLNLNKTKTKKNFKLIKIYVFKLPNVFYQTLFQNSYIIKGMCFCATLQKHYNVCTTIHFFQYTWKASNHNQREKIKIWTKKANQWTNLNVLHSICHHNYDQLWLLHFCFGWKRRKIRFSGCLMNLWWWNAGQSGLGCFEIGQRWRNAAGLVTSFDGTRHVGHQTWHTRTDIGGYLRNVTCRRHFLSRSLHLLAVNADRSDHHHFLLSSSQKKPVVYDDADQR